MCNKCSEILKNKGKMNKRTSVRKLMFSNKAADGGAFVSYFQWTEDFNKTSTKYKYT